MLLTEQAGQTPQLELFMRHMRLTDSALRDAVGEEAESETVVSVSLSFGW